MAASSQPGAYSVTVNVAHGQNQWASVEGRKAFEPVSDCMGAVHTKCCSHDIKGPIAICKSVTKLDHARATNGTLLNWKFSPSTLVGETGRDNFIALMDEYVHRKGMHSQFHRGQPGDACGRAEKTRTNTATCSSASPGTARTS